RHTSSDRDWSSDVCSSDLLLEISRALTSQLDVDEVLRIILEAAVAMLSGSVGLIALCEEDKVFHTRATIGVTSEQIELFRPLLRSEERRVWKGDVCYGRMV